jgi:hypothetical protein
MTIGASTEFEIYYGTGLAALGGYAPIRIKATQRYTNFSVNGSFKPTNNQMHSIGLFHARQISRYKWKIFKFFLGAPSTAPG